MQQIRFAEAERLMTETLESLEGEPDALRARLHALHAWAVAAQGRAEGVVAEADAARAMARAADPLVELQVLEHTNAARDEVDEATVGDWAELEERARALGAWQQVVSAARIRATYLAFDDPEAGMAAMADAGDLARAHGQLEQAGWCDYARCEQLWVVGRWDEALKVGMSAVDLAERNGYERLAFRTYVVLLPLAAARGDPAPADRYVAWGEAAAMTASPVMSAYGRLLRAAGEVWIAQAHGQPWSAPADEIIETIIPMSNPHFVAATEAVIRAWIDVGRMDLAGAGADRVAGFAADADATTLMRASGRARGRVAGRGSPEAAVDLARAAHAPWWEARALRTGESDAEAVEIERRLALARNPTGSREFQTLP